MITRKLLIKLLLIVYGMVRHNYKVHDLNYYQVFLLFHQPNWNYQKSRVRSCC